MVIFYFSFNNNLGFFGTSQLGVFTAGSNGEFKYWDITVIFLFRLTLQFNNIITMLPLLNVK